MAKRQPSTLSLQRTYGHVWTTLQQQYDQKREHLEAHDIAIMIGEMCTISMPMQGRTAIPMTSKGKVNSASLGFIMPARMGRMKWTPC